MTHYPAFWLWTAFLILFFVLEGIGVYHDARGHGDAWTFTHYLAAHCPMSLRVAILAWLAYHFLIQHIKG